LFYLFYVVLFGPDWFLLVLSDSVWFYLVLSSSIFPSFFFVYFLFFQFFLNLPFNLSFKKLRFLDFDTMVKNAAEGRSQL